MSRFNIVWCLLAFPDLPESPNPQAEQRFK
jgi:hypothetical protein